jgi:hypothetical protein
MKKKEDKNPNIGTNYYLQQRYDAGELNTEVISFEADTASPIYSDHNQDTILKKRNIEELEKCIRANTKIVDIIDAIPVEKTIHLGIEEVNKIYSFCMLTLKSNDILKHLTRIEMFDLITTYLNLNDKEVKYFHKNLSITFKSELLEELSEQGLYRRNKLF